MNFLQISSPSKLCKSCNGSGKITYFMPECDLCYGYGIVLETIKPIRKSLTEIIIVENMSMSDLSYILDSIRQLDSVKCIIQSDVFTVKLLFSIDSVYGTIWLRPRRLGVDIGKVFDKKIVAACRAMGYRVNVSRAKTILNGTNIRNRVIKILTNPVEWEVVGLRYDSFKIGLDGVT